MSGQMSRRGFMTKTILAVFAFVGSTLAVALGGFAIFPALKRKTPAWSDAGTVEDLVIDQPSERRFAEVVKSGWMSEKQERSVWLVRKQDGSVVAFTANCPHLGCGYRWITERSRFECPCHGSIFDLDGKILAGPAPRRLDTLDTKIENGRLFLRYEVFQLGTAKRIVA